MPTSGFAKASRGSSKGGKRDASGLGHRNPNPHQLFHARRMGRKGRR